MAGDRVVIFGGGAVGRGLIGRVLSENGFGLVFVDADRGLVEGLGEAGGYTVRVAGKEQRECEVRGYEVLAAGDGEKVAGAICGCAFMVTSVGGQNLGKVAGSVKSGLEKREGVLNILVCENWPEAEKVLEEAIAGTGCEREELSCVSCSVEKMARRVEGSPDVVAEPGTAVYADAKAWAGDRPDIDGFVFTDNIEAYYARKLYTSNLGHAVLAYLGYLRGCEYIYEAMEEAEIRKHLTELLDVVRDGFLRSFEMEAAELDGHIAELLDWRYSNRALADTIRRVARSPLRKLGPKERLVGVARMLERHNLPGEEISRVIAAAMCYRDAEDTESVELEKMIEDKGVGTVLENVCGFGKDERLYAECVRAYERIVEKDKCS